jgi:hypothetical protein
MSGELLKQLALPVALFAVLFGMGLSLVPADFRRVLLNPKAKIVGLGCQLLLLPAVAFALALLFRLPGELAVGLMILAACPDKPGWWRSTSGTAPAGLGYSFYELERPSGGSLTAQLVGLRRRRRRAGGRQTASAGAEQTRCGWMLPR